jgi:hypothetical protein
MSLIKNDHMVEKFSATTSNPAFRDSILPGTLEACSFGFDFAGYKEIHHIFAELCVSIQYRILVGTWFRECLPQLLDNPRACRLFRNIKMEDPAATMFNNEEAIQDSEREGWHSEEVHGRDDFPMILQKSSPEFPCLAGRGQATDIARHGTFGDVEAKFQKFTVNPRSAPGGILLHHPLDESSNLDICSWPAGVSWPRSKAPEQTKASSMPADNGFRFDNDQDVAPCRPKLAEQNPKSPIPS